MEQNKTQKNSLILIFDYLNGIILIKTEMQQQAITTILTNEQKHELCRQLYSGVLRPSQLSEDHLKQLLMYLNQLDDQGKDWKLKLIVRNTINKHYEEVKWSAIEKNLQQIYIVIAASKRNKEREHLKPPSFWESKFNLITNAVKSCFQSQPASLPVQSYKRKTITDQDQLEPLLQIQSSGPQNHALGRKEKNLSQHNLKSKHYTDQYFQPE